MVNYILGNYALYILHTSPFTRYNREKYSLHIIKRTEELHFEKRGL